MPRNPPGLDNLTHHPGSGDGLTNMGNTIGAFRPEFFGDDAEFTPVADVETTHLAAWARLVRYCHATPDSPVTVGYVDADHGPDIELLAARIPGEDRVVTVAPRMDGGESDDG